jgi:hypothetical protein
MTTLNAVLETVPKEMSGIEAAAYAFGWYKALEAKNRSVIDESAAKRIATVLGWAPKREWVGLTDEEMLAAIRPLYRSDKIAQNAFDLSKDEYKAIEAALKDKNT